MFNEVSGMGETKRINYYLSKLMHCVAVVIQDHLPLPASSIFHFVLLFVMLILSALQYGHDIPICIEGEQASSTNAFSAT